MSAKTQIAGNLFGAISIQESALLLDSVAINAANVPDIYAEGIAFLQKEKMIGMRREEYYCKNLN